MREDVVVEGETEAGVNLTDFVSYMPMHSYVFTPTREFWPGSSVNARVPPVIGPDLKPIPAARWLDKNRPVEQATWAPGEPLLVEGRLIAAGGWIERPGCTTLNTYRPPTLVPCAGEVDPWLAHVRDVYPDDASHIVQWLAQRVQHPEIKLNHALVLGGAQGIGKDTILEPIKQCIGAWNFIEVNPQQLLGRFNGFLKSVILRVNEARDLGEVDRFSFYDHTKNMIAAPPDVLRVDEKHLRETHVLNITGVVITTNHKTDGLYLPADDRRHYVAWSDRQITDFHPGYWTGLYGWFDDGGAAAVAAYLHALPLDDFDAKAPPPKTAAFWEIVDAGCAPENAEMNDALDNLGRPDAVTLETVKMSANSELSIWLGDRKNARKAPHRLEECGYVKVRNNDADDGLWSLRRRRQAIYCKRKMLPKARLLAAEKLAAANR